MVTNATVSVDVDTKRRVDTNGCYMALRWLLYFTSVIAVMKLTCSVSLPPRCNGLVCGQ